MSGCCQSGRPCWHLQGMILTSPGAMVACHNCSNVMLVTRRHVELLKDLPTELMHHLSMPHLSPFSVCCASYGHYTVSPEL